jgi:hypothetical protein
VLLLGLAHAAALMPVWLSATPLGLRLGLTAAIAVSLVLGWRRLVLRRGAAAVRWLRWEAGDGWRLRNGRDEELRVRLGPHSFVSRALVLVDLRRRTGRGGYTAVLPWDALDAESFRRLRVLLRSPAGRSAD